LKKSEAKKQEIMMRLMQMLAIAATWIASTAAQAPPEAVPPQPASSTPIRQRVQPPARITEFRAQPASIQPGQSATLVWATENPSSVAINPEPGRVTPRGTRLVTPKATTTFTLTVLGPNNTTLTREVTVTVAGTQPVTSAIAATPSVKPAPRTADGKADLTGVYNFGGVGGGRGGRGGPAAGAPAAPAGPELKPGAEKYRVVRGPTDAGGTADCMPLVGPQGFGVPYQTQIVQNRDYVIILHEYPGVFRIIPTNGAVHPVNPDPTWMGDSVGKWEGDTLVVDTVGFNDKTEISGFKHTESLHMVERFSRPNYDTLQYEATLEDPNVFVRPFTVIRSFALRPDLNKIDEFVCENNRDYSKFFEKK
jgi:hypothetical protein